MMKSIIHNIWSGNSSMEANSPDDLHTGSTSSTPRASTLGLRVVNPHHTNVVMDIIFLHGLTGDRETTWTAKQAAASWLDLFLTDDIPHARIITYGYDADVVNFWSMASQNRVGDHSQKFLVSLANFREGTNTNTRPLLFVAHSLGGIICQDALLKSRGSPDLSILQILKYTKGIIFMGTPHCGSGLAEWAMVGSHFLKYFRRVNQGTLKVLQHESEVMARIRQDFHTMLRECDQRKDTELKIICFFEELPVRNIGMIVPQQSAILDRYQSVGIHANHMDMTKFSSNQDQDYQNVLFELRRFVESSEPQPEEGSPSEIFQPLTTQALPQGRNRTNVSTNERDQSLDRQEINSSQPINHFSGNFDSGGGKMIQGGVFNSGGGAMNF